MDRDELVRSAILVVVLIALAVLIAQSQRECEVPGSSWVPCVSLKVIGLIHAMRPSYEDIVGRDKP